MRFLAMRSGGWKVDLAVAVELTKHLVLHVAKAENAVSPRMARCEWRDLQDVGIDVAIACRYPAADACPHLGRTD